MINTGVAIGRFVFEHELREVGDTVVLKNRLAVDRAGGKDEDGNFKAGFFDVEAWGKVAELLDEYTEKGSLIAVEYSLKQDTWTDEDEDGKEINRSKVLLKITAIQFVGSKSSDDEDEEEEEKPRSKSKSRSSSSKSSSTKKSSSKVRSKSKDDDEDDDEDAGDKEPVGAGSGKGKKSKGGYNPFSG